MKLFKIDFDITKTKFGSNGIDGYWIVKKLYLFNRVIFRDFIHNFIDLKEGPVPFLIKTEAVGKMRLMRMKSEERFLPLFNDKYYITQYRETHIIIKETYFLGFSLSYMELKESKSLIEIVDELNKILDKERFT